MLNYYSTTWNSDPDLQPPFSPSFHPDFYGFDVATEICEAAEAQARAAAIRAEARAEGRASRAAEKAERKEALAKAAKDRAEAKKVRKEELARRDEIRRKAQAEGVEERRRKVQARAEELGGTIAASIQQAGHIECVTVDEEGNTYRHSASSPMMTTTTISTMTDGCSYTTIQSGFPSPHTGGNATLPQYDLTGAQSWHIVNRICHVTDATGYEFEFELPGGGYSIKYTRRG